MSMPVMPTFSPNAVDQQNTHNGQAMMYNEQYPHKVNNMPQMMAAGPQRKVQPPANRGRPGMQRTRSVTMHDPHMISAPSTPSSHHNNTPLMLQKNNPGFKMDGDAMARRMAQQQFSQQQQQQMLQRQLMQLMGQPRPPQGAAMDPQMESMNPAQSPQAAAAGVPNQGGPARPAGAANMANQNEVNAKIFKRKLGNASIMRILDLIDLVSHEPYETISRLDFWVCVCNTYFLPSAVIRFSTAIEKSEDDGLPAPMQNALYELNLVTAPKFFLATVLSLNVAKHHVTLPGLKFQVLNNGCVLLASRLNVVFNYLDGSVGSATGACRILLNRLFSIQLIDCSITEYRKTISMGALEKAWNNVVKSNKKDKSASLHQVLEEAECSRLAKNCGLPEAAMHVLQMSDVMALLRPLMAFTVAGNINSPLKALEVFVANGNQRMSALGMASSPSPQTSVDEYPAKKRTLSNAMNSPMNQERR